MRPRQTTLCIPMLYKNGDVHEWAPPSSTHGIWHTHIMGDAINGNRGQGTGERPGQGEGMGGVKRKISLSPLLLLAFLFLRVGRTVYRYKDNERLCGG